MFGDMIVCGRLEDRLEEGEVVTVVFICGRSASLEVTMAWSGPK